MVSVQLDEVSHLITQKLETTVETVGQFVPACKAISALLPYAARQESYGRFVTLDVLLDAVRTSEGFIWNRIVPMLFDETSPLTVVLVSPYVDWHSPSLADRGTLLAQWATAATAVPYAEEVGRSVVDVLFQVLMWSFLRPHIPVGIWGLLEKQPSLPPMCYGRTFGTEGNAVRHIRALGDIKILKSYLLLVWSEWDVPWSSSDMCALVRADFGGSEAKGHREDLIKRLDRVLERLDRGLGYLRQQKPRLRPDHVQEARRKYRRIREALLEAERGPMVETQTRTPPGMATSLAC